MCLLYICIIYYRTQKRDKFQFCRANKGRLFYRVLRIKLKAPPRRNIFKPLFLTTARNPLRKRGWKKAHHHPRDESMRIYPPSKERCIHIFMYIEKGFVFEGICIIFFLGSPLDALLCLVRCVQLSGHRRRDNASHTTTHQDSFGVPFRLENADWRRSISVFT